MPGSTDALVRVSMMQKSRTHGCVRIAQSHRSAPMMLMGLEACTSPPGGIQIGMTALKYGRGANHACRIYGQAVCDCGNKHGGVLMKDLFNLQQLVIIVLGAISGPFNSITIPAVSA